MTAKEKRAQLEKISDGLEKLYPKAECALEWGGEDWKLLVMGTLSAQCTDARVNLVCKDLFRKFPTPKALGEGDLTEIEQTIQSCGLFRTKAKNIQGACRALVSDYGGKVPDSMEELLKLPGVGRKVANLLLGDLYGKGGTVADTHCIRICGRLGMYPETEKDPRRVELKMDALLKPEERCGFCHRIVQFGRDVCTARAPKCRECPIREYCKKGSHDKEFKG